jgi:ADP-ribose pyrophosphatase
VRIPNHLRSYFELVEQRPDLFDNSGGRLKILLNPADIISVEKAVARLLIERGLSQSGATAGCVLEDPWFFVLRDAIEFPDGSRRLHARVVNRNNHGSAVLPLLNGQVILIRHFRHPTRQWMLEIPRGAIESGQTPEGTARREIEEEIGGEIKELMPLGFIHGATNLYNGGAHLFCAQLSSIGSPQLAEGITAIEQLTPKEFENLIRNGKVLDSVTVAVFTHARLRGLI